jgi:ABC-type multidrug transport system fused ATPase/permease subunit
LFLEAQNVSYFQVFTTIALLNMLIAPLNTFPWALNGLTEAWVSLKRIQKLLFVSQSKHNFLHSLNQAVFTGS